ncbi:P-type ATPase, transmembrane domain superfamily [Sesbania bispinosa]|nr:P-type ATPase, transmembrane domain superfamily [Sesbania bispinosa]
MVIGGTVNENGILHVKVTRVGSESALSQIVRLVESAQMAKAPVQKLADQISKYFVPLVIVLSLSTFLSWFVAGKLHAYPKSWIPSSMNNFELALQFGISLMVIACPCALGLATPTAVMVGTGVGATQGVLIKGGQALESAHKVLPNTTGPLRMPVIGMDSAPDFTCKKDTKEAIIEAVKQGYRHIDSAASYGSEKALGEALKEAIELGLVSRENLFVTSKFWVTENHPHFVLPA